MNKTEFNNIVERYEAGNISGEVYPEGYIVKWKAFIEDTLFYIEEKRECWIRVDSYHHYGNLFMEILKAVVNWLLLKPVIYEIYPKSLKTWDNGEYISESDKKLILARISEYLKSFYRAKIVIRED